MATPQSRTSSDKDAGNDAGKNAGAEPGATAPRSIAPMRWPKPSGGGVGLFALWAVGGLVGALAPALVVRPSDDDASTSALLGAFGLTVLGVLIMVAACVLLYRRGRDGAVIILAVVPTGVLLAGGMMLLATKLFV